MRSGFVVGRKTQKVFTVVYLTRAAVAPVAGPFTLAAVVTK
jgi:hypothetical protein